MRKLKIEEISNGYLLTSYFINADTNEVEQQDLICIEEDEITDKATLIKLLETTADFFGYQYDKYGSENLNITFDKKGHKLD